VPGIEGVGGGQRVAEIGSSDGAIPVLAPVVVCAISSSIARRYALPKGGQIAIETANACLDELIAANSVT
jgi:hypothetical protein